LASSRIDFFVSGIKPGAKLVFGVGMNATRGDGAEGIISVEADKNTEIVYRKYLDPPEKTEDRKWFDEAVDLSKYAGKKVKIAFAAKPGPQGDAIEDWFAWSNPELK
jgi:hypothetical protein